MTMVESKPDDEYHGLLFLDLVLPTWLKIIICMAALVIVSIQSVKSFNELTLDFSPVYVIAPTVGMFCLAGAFLRLVGIRWQYVYVFWGLTLLSLPITYIIMAIASFMRWI
jgi:hypothetical protein